MGGKEVRVFQPTIVSILSLTALFGAIGCGQDGKERQDSEGPGEVSAATGGASSNGTKVAPAEASTPKPRLSSPPPTPNFTPPPPPSGPPPGLGGPQSPRVAQLQGILKKANPDYQGQGRFHEENGEILAGELPNCGLRDLSPLKGLKLMGLDLSGNPLREIRHLKGMPLRSFYAENTLLEDLTPLKGAPIAELRLNGCPIETLAGLEGMPLESLYLPGTKVKDLSALAGSKVRQLWLNDAPVSDLSPLAGAPIVSLTLHRTQVSDLTFVRKLPVIQRLHIGETLVTDLTPLKGVPLSRLVFTPAKIEKGMEFARQIFGLREIGVRFDDGGRELMPPDHFWARYDKGEFR